MNFLTKILAVDVPENTHLDTWSLSFRGLSVGWLVLLIAIIVMGLASAAFFNLLEKGTLGWIRRAILIGLRSALLFLLLFLIMRPVLLAEFVGERPQGVALLLDTSQSMQQRDKRLSDLDKARVAISLGKLAPKLPIDLKDLPASAANDLRRVELVRNALVHPEWKLLDKLQELGPVRPYLVGHDVAGLQDTQETDIVKKIVKAYQEKAEDPKAADSRTALADGIIKILQARDADLPSAIVVCTDGQDNASKYSLLDAGLKCAEKGVPLHIYGVGSTEGALMQLKEVGAPDTIFVEDTVAIPLRWRAQGLKQGQVEITLTLGGKEVAKKKINVQSGDDLRDALSFVVPKDPEKCENLDLVAKIQYKMDAGPPLVDTLTRTLRVAESKIRILYIEHGPRWEFKFLQPALLRDRRIEVDFILVNAASEVAKSRPFLSEFPKTRDKFFESKYNLIILGDVASTYFSKEQQEWIREFVQNRGGLIAMAGRQHMPSSYENTPLAEVLPVEFKKEKFTLDAETRTQEYQPTLTVDGQRADWLALADTPEENLDVWQKKLTGFHWNYPVAKLKPAATPLIVNPRAKMGDQANPPPMPILVTHFYGKGQVIWMGTDETWRWRWNYQDRYFVRFWGQLIYQAGLPSLLGDASKRAQMALDRSQAMVGSRSVVYVRLLDKDFNPRRDAQVEAELEYLDGERWKQKLTLNSLRGRPGEYSALIQHDHAGRFALHVKNPDVNTFSFRVDLPPRHELEESGLAERPLRDAADLSGGRFYREEDLHELTNSLKVKKTEFSRRQEVILWNPLAILVFLGLITTEWLVRKFSDLS